MSTYPGLASPLADPRSDSAATTATAARQAFSILRFGFTVAPIVAGLDKFLHLLTD